jgi:hypothetical protein
MHRGQPHQQGAALDFGSDLRGRSIRCIRAGTNPSAYRWRLMPLIPNEICPIFRLYSRLMAGSVRKIVAAFVLIWAFADLSVPGLCQADDNKIDYSLSVVAFQGKNSPALSPGGVPTPDRDGTPDECFCCSPYASPTAVFSHHASANLAMTTGCVAPEVFLPLPMATQQLALVERRRSHPISPDILPSPLRC